MRGAALSAGLRHGLELSGPELASLLEASMARQDIGSSRLPWFPWMGDIFLLVRTEEACAVAESLLLRVQPRVRAEMLADDALRDSDLFPPLEDWLHAQWAREDQRRAVSCRVDYGLLPAPREFPFAVRLLGEWSEARPLLLRLLCDLRLEEEVRRPMLEELFERERAVAIRWALAAIDWPGNTTLVRRLLHSAARAPEPGDRALFLKALHGSDAVAQCLAIEGLLGLGESGAAWCEWLTSLLHANHPAVRLRAAAGLIREGRREELPALRRTALQASEPWLRAEALRWLGEVDAEASQPVFAAALSDRGSWDSHHIPLGADEALWALSRRGAPEDLSLLLNAYLRGCFSYVMDEYLVFHLARQEGRPAEEVPAPECRLHALDILQRGS